MKNEYNYEHKNDIIKKDIFNIKKQMANLLTRLGGKTAVNVVSKNLYKHLVADA